jgi:hypothetical protein
LVLIILVVTILTTIILHFAVTFDHLIAVDFSSQVLLVHLGAKRPVLRFFSLENNLCSGSIELHLNRDVYGRVLEERLNDTLRLRATILLIVDAFFDLSKVSDAVIKNLGQLWLAADMLLVLLIHHQYAVQ